MNPVVGMNLGPLVLGAWLSCVLYTFYAPTVWHRNVWIVLQELHKAVAADSDCRKSFSSMEKYETLLNDPETNSELNDGDLRTLQSL